MYLVPWQRLQVRPQRPMGTQLQHDPRLAVGRVEAEAVHLDDVAAGANGQRDLDFVF